MIDQQDRQSILDWLASWGDCVATRDFEKARRLFRSDVVGFGTYSDFVVGLDNLESEQWRQVWPTIANFRFDLDNAWVDISTDRLMGQVAARWQSTGYHDNGTTFDRPGRCTVTLRREDARSPWRGTHTHFSLERGVPQASHGDKRQKAADE